MAVAFRDDITAMMTKQHSDSATDVGATRCEPRQQCGIAVAHNRPLGLMDVAPLLTLPDSKVNSAGHHAPQAASHGNNNTINMARAYKTNTGRKQPNKAFSTLPCAWCIRLSKCCHLGREKWAFRYLVAIFARNPLLQRQQRMGPSECQTQADPEYIRQQWPNL
jgi:hypothetical protein